MSQEQDTLTDDESHENQFTIIGIGASAGGLEALKSFFDAVPPDFQHTFVVVQHLSPDYKSLMGELLSKNTKMPIHEVTHDMVVNGASVYLIPPGKNMILQSNRFVLTDKPTGGVLNFPIDIFFESLAKESKEQSVGIILSGTGSDGTIGLRAIKEIGGLAIVQNPASSAFDGMPMSAIGTGLIDFILPPWEMPAELHRYFSTERKALIGNLTDGQQANVLHSILKYLQKQIDVDFTLYKRPTLVRRLQRRLVVTNCDTLEEYYEYLHQNPNEAHTLYREFLIHVTHFFRDPIAWDILASDVLPKIINDKTSSQPIKCWVVGCSSGEEAYTLAILVDEALNASGRNLEVKIFATDIEKEHIDHAAQGTYQDSILSNISQERLDHYFNKVGNEYRINRTLRRSIIFSQHDALKDPPFGKMDLVLCRNFLIYLLPEVQERLLNRLHYALNIGGYLFLGSSESLNDETNAFAEVNRRWRIYQSLRHANRLGLIAQSNLYQTNITKANDLPSVDMANTMSNLLLSEMDAASIFIDSDYKLIHAQGNYKYFLDIPANQFSLSLLKMVHESLYIPLSGALTKAARMRERVSTSKVWLDLPNNRRQQIHLFIEPYATTGSGQLQFLVLLLPRAITDIFIALESASEQELETAAHEGKALMEQALKEAQIQLQSALEEAQTSNEELQATNEELMAANEELQSTNEELQSVNEELHTVNAEYQLKVDELERLNAEVDNLIRSTRIGTIFLDLDLNIRSFTPSISAQFDLLTSDVGRPLEHLASKLQTEDMEDLLGSAREVMYTGEPSQREIQTKDNRYFLQRINPYLDARQKVGGVVLSFVDITIQKENELRVKELQERLEIAIDIGNIGIWDYDLVNGDIFWSDKMYDIYGIEQEDFNGTLEQAVSTIHPDDVEMALSTWEDDLLNPNQDEHTFAYRIKGIDKIVRYIRGNGVIERNHDGRAISTYGVAIDITDIQLMTSELELTLSDLKESNNVLEQFAYAASHDLREPMNTLSNYMSLIKQKYSDVLDEQGLKMIEFAHDSSERMKALIHGLLLYSRADSEMHEQFISDVNPKDLIDDIQQDLKSIIEENDVQLEVNVGGYITCHPAQIRQVFSNLILNAVKYAQPTTPPHIIIEMSENETHWQFSVCDNGIGIEEMYWETVFQIFKQLQPRSQQEGIGMGLAMCQRIITLHDGKIWLESEINQGTTVYFTLSKQLIS
ncbi:MAG: CheR family methyltransferase [Chloroflexota bacterium]